MASQLKAVNNFLQYSCHKHNFSSCVVVGVDGFALCSAGEPISDEFSAYLPEWLEVGKKIGHSSSLGELACCCAIPKKRSNLMLVWDISFQQERLFFAVLTPKIAADTLSTLNNIADRVRTLLESPNRDDE